MFHLCIDQALTFAQPSSEASPEQLHHKFNQTNTLFLFICASTNVVILPLHNDRWCISGAVGVSHIGSA